MIFIDIIEMKNNDKSIALSNEQSLFIRVPEELIINSKLNPNRVAIYSYFCVRSGLDNCLLLSIKHLSEWLGKTVNKHLDRNTYTKKLIDTIVSFKEMNILNYNDILTITSCFDVSFNKDCCEGNRFAKIYLDELNEIIKYNNPNIKDTKFDNCILLLVFAYLRLKIFTRIENNIIRGSEFFSSVAEAYDCYYTDIARDLSITEKSVSKAIKILSELNLIYEERRLPIRISKHSKNNSNEIKYYFIIPTHIFTNTYKRVTNKSGRYVIASGEQYYLPEVKLKKQLLIDKQYRKDYKTKYQEYVERSDNHESVNIE